MQESPRTRDFVEMKDIAAVLWRRKWLIVLVTLMGATSAFAISRRMTPVYEASTTLLIDQARNSQPSDNSAITASERLARTYAQLLTKRPVVEESLTRLELSTDLDEIKNGVRVQIVQDTQLIELKVQNTNPILAAELANVMVEVFAEQISALQAGRFDASKASLQAQIDVIGEQIQANEAAIANLGAPRTASGIANLQRLQTELAQFQASYTNLLQSYEQVRTAEAGTISNIFQVEPAVPPSAPIRPRIMLNTLLAGAVAGLIAISVVFLIEHLDDKIRTTEDAERIFQVPVLGTIADTKELNGKDQGLALLAEEQDSEVGEAFRSLRTNLDFLGNGNPGSPSYILVASPGPDEGKTTIASHLAVSIANSGKRVVLIDADIRRPGVHEVFGVPNELGLSDMLIDNLEPQGVVHSFDNSRLELITSGRRVDDPSELFGSSGLSEVLAQLRGRSDTVIFDGPPFLATEALVLASRLESVLLVIQPGRTREEAARMITKQLRRAKANLIGVVLNRVSKSQAYASAGYFDYEEDDDEERGMNREQAEQENVQAPSDLDDMQTSPID